MGLGLESGSGLWGFRPYIQGGDVNLWYYDGFLQLKVPIRKKVFSFTQTHRASLNKYLQYIDSINK